MATYTISLDEVDLALLPLRTHRFNDFLKKEHFEFQVMKTETVEESVPAIRYKCHICAIEVPAAFASEHVASIKHEANARIANEAAQRTRALISALPPPPAEQPNARFCANCSTTVSKNHDKTKEHRVAVMHDKLLWELMTAYVGDDNDNHDEIEHSDISDSDTEDLIRKKSKENKGVNINGFEESGMKTHKVNDSVINKKENKSEVKIGNANDKRVDFYAYEKQEKYEREETKEKNEGVNYDDAGLDMYNEVNDGVQHNILKPTEQNGDVLDVEVVDIQTNNNEQYENVVNNRIDTEASKTETGNNESTNCKVHPFDIISKFEEAQVTKYTQTQNQLEYVEFMTKDFKLVKVNSDHYHSFIRRENKIECIVCSRTFQCEGAESHMFSVRHLNQIPSTLIDEHCVRKINDIYSHCILCNQMIKTGNVSKHLLTINHGVKEDRAVTKDRSRQSMAAQLAVKKPANQDVKLGTASQHADGKATVQPKHIIIEEKAKSTAGSVVKSQVTSTSEEKAKNVSNEVKSANDWPVIYPYELTNQDGCVRCVICDCKVPNSSGNRKSHLVGSNHAKNVKSRRLQPYEANQDTVQGTVRCRICTCNVPNTPKNRNEHLYGSIHMRMLKNYENTTVC